MKFHIFFPDELFAQMEENRHRSINRSRFIQKATIAFLEQDQKGTVEKGSVKGQDWSRDPMTDYDITEEMYP